MGNDVVTTPHPATGCRPIAEQCRGRKRLVPAMLALCAIATSQVAMGQMQKTTPLSYSASISGFGEFNTDLDNNGGSFSVSGVIVNGSIESRLGPQWSAGLSAGYQYEHWSFSSPAAFGGEAPWGSINRPSVGASITYRPSEDLSFLLAPQIEWNYETGADADSQTYGAVFGVTKVFSPTMVLGIGAGVFRQIDETKVFPFLIVNWWIDDKWRLSNPFRAGPAGGAGLELVYTIDDNWEAGGGGTWREYRFRLAENGPNPNGIGQNQGIPLFARLTRKVGPSAHLDLYAGAVVAGTVKLRDSGGNTLVSSDYNAAPFIGLTLRGNF